MCVFIPIFKNAFYIIIVSAVWSCTLNVYAAKSSYHPQDPSTLRTSLPWSLEVGVGYGIYQHMYTQDGNAVQTRMGIAKEFVRSKRFHAGLELGVQNGNTGRLDIPPEQLDLLGGIPVESTIKPTMDMLITSQFSPKIEGSIFTLIKAGIILRRLQFNRSVNDITKINPEFVVGVGYTINRYASVFLAYQSIISSNPNFTVDAEQCTGHVESIPGTNNILLGVSIYLE